MSAYLVGNETIAAVVYGMQRCELPITLRGRNVSTEWQAVGQMLVDQNVASVNARYGADYDFDFGRIYGAACCYEYQSCGTKDWLGSDIERAISALKDDVAEKAIRALGQEVTWY